MKANNLIITGNLISVNNHSFTISNENYGIIDININKILLKKIKSYANINDHIGVKGHIDATSGKLQIVADKVSFINK